MCTDVKVAVVVTPIRMHSIAQVSNSCAAPLWSVVVTSSSGSRHDELQSGLAIKAVGGHRDVNIESRLEDQPRHAQAVVASRAELQVKEMARLRAELPVAVDLGLAVAIAEAERCVRAFAQQLEAAMA